MRGRYWAAVGGIVASLALTATASAQTYTPGGRTLGDVLPELAYLGNTGYDAQNYDLTLNYDPVANIFKAGTKADITLRATQNLSEFALDFRGLNVTAVTIDGVAADLHAARTAIPRGRRSLPQQADRHAGGRHPQQPRLPRGRRVQRHADGHGGPGRVLRGLDPHDGRVVRGQRADGRDDVVPEQQPPGRQGDLRLPHHGPGDAHGARQRRARGPNPPALNADGTRTWNWHDGYPTATYLTTATVGVFDFTQGTRRDREGRERQRARALQRLGEHVQRHAEDEPQRGRRARGPDHQVPQRLQRHELPVRLDRRGRRHAAVLARLRARGPDQDPLPVGLDQPQHAVARDLAPVVRQQRLAEAVEGHLAQRGLGDLVGRGTGRTSSTARSRRPSSSPTATTRRPTRRAGTPRPPS